MCNIEKRNSMSFYFRKLTTHIKIHLFFISLFAFAFSMQAKAMAQSELINLSLNNTSIIEAVKAVEKQTSYKFVYSNADVDVSRKVSVNAVKATIESVAKTIFHGYNVSVKGKNVIVTPDQKMHTKSHAVQQSSQRTVTGQVIDAETGETIIGANIRVENNADRGAITDIDGRFSIPVSGNSTVLIISYIGYEEMRIEVGNRTNLGVIQLKVSAEALEEVVITAFGTGQKKESVVGSIQTVSPKELKVPTANLSNSFAGRLSGVIAYQRSGQPGSNASEFYIRGISTLSGMTSPLIILDGVEVSSSDLDAIDPDIIDGFSILKDATATAMYGTRGANGVMIVTTKSGADLDKPIIGMRVETNMTRPTKVPQFVDGFRYMEIYNEAVTSEQTGNLLYTKSQIDNTRNNVNPYIWPNVDWYGSLFNDMAYNQKANFNIRGGTKKITYFMNVGVNHETGMLRNEAAKLFSYSNNINLMKYTFQNNIDFHMTKSSMISLHLNVQLNDLRQPNTKVEDLYSAVMNSNPVDFPVSYPADGVNNWIYWGAYSGGNDQGAVNPMASLTNGYTNIFNSKVMANIDFEQKLDFLLEGLRFKTLFSFTNFGETKTTRSQGINRYALKGYTENSDGTYELNVDPFGTSNPTKPVLSTNSTNKGDRRIYIQAFLDYLQSFGDHNVNAMALWNIDQYDNNVPNGLIQSLPRRKMGFSGRVTYDYARKYLIELNAGYNGSENFAEGHRWGFFPSIGLGWNVSQEKFFEPYTNTISNLKLRGSYGLVGNDQLLDEYNNLVRFIYMSDIVLQDKDVEFTTGDKGQETNRGPAYTRYQNNSLTWEVGEKMNVGMDMQLFRSLNITFDAFKEIRRDIFQQRFSIPNYLGTADTKVYGNLAKVKSHGFDLAIDYGKMIDKEFSIQFKGTFTFARSKVLEYDEAPGMRPALSKIGKNPKAIYGYVTDGLYIDDADIAHNPTSTLGNIAIAPGDIKYVDQPNKDGEYDNKITSDDRVAMGYPTVPEIVYGFGPTMAYKNWDFSFFFQGVANTSLMMSGFAPFGTQYNRNVLSWIADDYWSPTNQNPYAAYPRVTKNDNTHNAQNSDFWLRNASFLKLKNAEIGYTFDKVRLYVNGINLLTFSPFKLWDPEMGGGKGLSYPTQMTVNAGIMITLR